MKQILYSLCFLGFTFLTSCSDALSVGTVSEGSRYRSLISLWSDQETPFQRTSYDLSGETILLIDTVTLVQKRVELHEDTVLKYNYDPKTNFASFRWESVSTAQLFSFRQPDTLLQNGGMILCGTITDDDTLIYETPILWLPFPGIEGTLSEQLSDDILDVNRIYSANSSRLNPLGHIDQVYVYVNETDEKQLYSWFSIGSTLAAQLEYRNGKRIRSLQEIR